MALHSMPVSQTNHQWHGAARFLPVHVHAVAVGQVFAALEVRGQAALLDLPHLVAGERL